MVRHETMTAMSNVGVDWQLTEGSLGMPPLLSRGCSFYSRHPLYGKVLLQGLSLALFPAENLLLGAQRLCACAPGGSGQLVSSQTHGRGGSVHARQVEWLGQSLFCN